MRLIVLCPAAKRTGGPEALHQLVDSLARQRIPSAICYIGTAELAESPTDQKPEAYRHYLGDVIGPEDVHQDDHIIFPETFVHQIKLFPRNTFSIWWLSINNFNGWVTLAGRSVDMRSRLRVVKSVIENPTNFKVNNSSLLSAKQHLVQSFYAETVLCRKGYQGRVSVLTDYITTGNLVSQDVSEKRAVGLSVVTNGNKGIIFQKLFSWLAPSIKVRPLKGLSSSEMRDSLGRSDIYIDFGHQPGKDRLPREAAVLGNVVFVRKKGAGNNSIDTPIADDFKFRCTPYGLLSLKNRLKRHSAERWKDSLRLQQSYVTWIHEEKSRFDTEVRSVAQRLLKAEGLAG